MCAEGIGGGFVGVKPGCEPKLCVEGEGTEGDEAGAGDPDWVGDFGAQGIAVS